MLSRVFCVIRPERVSVFWPKVFTEKSKENSTRRRVILKIFLYNKIFHFKQLAKLSIGDILTRKKVLNKC